MNMPFNYGPRDHLGQILEYQIRNSQWNRIDIAVAWINEAVFAGASGEEGYDFYTAFENFLDVEGNIINITFGNSLHGSERQGIQHLINIRDANPNRLLNIYMYDGRETFHPKVFLFSNEESGRLIVGSTNLSNAAMMYNFEAFLSIEQPIDSEEITEAQDFFSELQNWNHEEPNQNLIIQIYERDE